MTSFRLAKEGLLNCCQMAEDKDLQQSKDPNIEHVLTV